jgi:prepilin-type N-terminal cleavage/methylation domain-containing protein
MKPRKSNAFTLVELLVVITIIGMLVALVLPAVNSAREQARQVQCTNNQRSYGQAIQQFESAKQYFPGYRQLLTIQNPQNPNAPAQSGIVSWQVVLLPYMGKTDTLQSIQSGVMANSTVTNPPPLPSLDFAICPSDNSIAGKSSPWTSYVANCGRLDKWVPNIGPCVAEITSPNVPETLANGLFNDKVLGTIAPGLNSLKVSMTDIKDGQGTTLMLAENVDAYYYCDNPIQVVQQANLSNLPTLVNNGQSNNCTERGAGFLWWDTSTSATQTPAPAPTQNTPPSGYPQAGINIQRGDWDPSGVKGWPQNFNNPSDQANYAARPASNHPGIVIVVFAGGNTKNLREDIDYPVYCLLMTPNGANSPTRSHDNAGKSWQKSFPLDEGKL